MKIYHLRGVNTWNNKATRQFTGKTVGNLSDPDEVIFDFAQENNSIILTQDLVRHNV